MPPPSDPPTQPPTTPPTTPPTGDWQTLLVAIDDGSGLEGYLRAQDLEEDLIVGAFDAITR